MCKAKVAGNIWFSYNSSPDLASKKILLLEFTYCLYTCLYTGPYSGPYTFQVYDDDDDDDGDDDDNT